MSAPAHVVWRTPQDRIALRLPMRALVMIGLLIAGLLIVLALSLATGSYGIALGEILDTLRGTTISRAIDNVVWEFRFPRALVAALAGAMTAVSGLALQNITRNGLADPSLVGISQGAALAVVLLLVAYPDLPPGLRPISAFAGSIIVALAIQALSYTRQGSNPIRFILIGIGAAAFISSITSALLTYGELDRAMAALAWLAGSINAANWNDVGLLGTAAAVLLLPMLGLSRSMAAMRLGDDMATGLGARVRGLRLVSVILAIGLAAIPTCVVGPLAFVGLIAPHAARRLGAASVGLHIILTALTGALLVSLADLVGRVAFAPVQIPAGLLTALIGVPLFVFLLIRSRPAAAH